MFHRLKDRLTVWAATRFVTIAFERLEAKHIGQQLDALLDQKLQRHSEPLQKPLAKWLRQVADELVSDQDATRID